MSMKTLVILCLFLTGCTSLHSASGPLKYKYGEKVHVYNGFYAGIDGTVEDYSRCGAELKDGTLVMRQATLQPNFSISIKLAGETNGRQMRILVACEFSGVVRDSFIARGHSATSCDLIPTERPGPHLQCDISEVDHTQYDMLLAFPPCTYLTNAANRWLKNPGRLEEREKAIQFVEYLVSLPIKKKAIENPVGALSTALRKPDQIIQPWQFGHGETKATCLWLYGLPLLSPTNVVDGRRPRVHWEPPGADRWKNRSRTLLGIAQAMAEQWG